MDRLLPPGAGEVGIYPARPPGSRGEGQYAFSGAFNLYSRRLYLTPLRDEPELMRFLASPGRRLVLAGWDAAGEIGDLPPDVHKIAAGGTGRTQLAFLANFPLEGR
jgi:hypothetical protein